MITIPIEDQTYKTFFIKYNNIEIQLYKRLKQNSKYNLKRLNDIIGDNILCFENYDTSLKYYNSDIIGRNYKNKWNYLIHTTDIINLENILKDGYLKSFPIKEKWKDKKSSEKVYTQYMFSDLIYNGQYWNYNLTNDKIIMVFSIDLIYNEKYIVCPGTHFGSCNLEENKNNRFNLGKLHNLNILKNFINDQILIDREMSPNTEDYFGYKFSHEITFDTVNLKYLVAILVHNNNFDIINNIIKKCNYNIKVIKINNKYYKKYFSII